MIFLNWISDPLCVKGIAKKLLFCPGVMQILTATNGPPSALPFSRVADGLGQAQRPMCQDLFSHPIQQPAREQGQIQSDGGDTT